MAVLTLGTYYSFDYRREIPAFIHVERSWPEEGKY